jgi:hypothetical protein
MVNSIAENGLFAVATSLLRFLNSIPFISVLCLKLNGDDDDEDIVKEKGIRV